MGRERLPEHKIETLEDFKKLVLSNPKEEEIYQQGMNEVINWVSKNIYFTDNQDMPRLFNVWKAKLKEWGFNV